MKLVAYVDGVGLCGPGLDSWQAARSIFNTSVPYEPRPLAVSAPATLPPAERRRIGLAIKVALAVAQEAFTAGQLDPKQLAAVFSSSGADNDNCDAICKVLASDDRSISPTRFHNSVHNAPAGYWGIASGAMTPATVLCAYDASFCAGLLEAITQVTANNTRTLLITYDMPYPEPLQSKRPLPNALGIALALSPVRGPQTLAQISVSLIDDAPATYLSNPALEGLRKTIPAARGLPLLQSLCLGQPSRVVLDYLEPLRMAVDIQPCN